MFYATVSEFFDTEGDFEENLDDPDAAPECENCGMTADEMPAAAWWANEPLADAVCCEVPVGR